jgi:hypothetical protein
MREKLPPQETARPERSTMSEQLGRVSVPQAVRYPIPKALELTPYMKLPLYKGAHIYAVSNYTKTRLCVTVPGAEQVVIVQGALPDCMDYQADSAIEETFSYSYPDALFRVKKVFAGGGMLGGSFYTIFCHEGITESVINILDHIESLRCFK